MNRNLSQLNPVRLTPYSERAILILSSHLNLSIPNGPFPVELNKTVILHCSCPCALHVPDASSSEQCTDRLAGLHC